MSLSLPFALTITLILTRRLDDRSNLAVLLPMLTRPSILFQIR
jgi:hypothetical protein